MKLIIILLISSFSSMSFAESVEQRLEKLQRRVIELEKRLGNEPSSTKTSGLKIKDLKNKKIESKSRALSSYGSTAPQLSRKQQKEIMNQIEQYKKKSQENQKVLDQIMKDDF